MEADREQFYQRRIAALEEEVAELRLQNAELLKQNAKLAEQVAKLTQQVARLSKNSSNSSKPPSSDIVKPPKPDNPKGPRRQGGQPGHQGVNRSPFRANQIDRVEELHPTACPHGHIGDVHGESSGAAEGVTSLFMHDQYYRVSAFGPTAKDGTSDALAWRFDGTSLVCFSLAGHGEELSANYGL